MFIHRQEKHDLSSTPPTERQLATIEQLVIERNVTLTRLPESKPEASSLIKELIALPYPSLIAHVGSQTPPEPQDAPKPETEYQADIRERNEQVRAILTQMTERHAA